MRSPALLALALLTAALSLAPSPAQLTGSNPLSCAAAALSPPSGCTFWPGGICPGGNGYYCIRNRGVYNYPPSGPGNVLLYYLFPREPISCTQNCPTAGAACAQVVSQGWGPTGTVRALARHFYSCN
jgi:hypothetical protein